MRKDQKGAGGSVIVVASRNLTAGTQDMKNIGRSSAETEIRTKHCYRYVKPLSKQICPCAMKMYGGVDAKLHRFKPSHYMEMGGQLHALASAAGSSKM
jgi:hypothetical protein